MGTDLINIKMIYLNPKRLIEIQRARERKLLEYQGNKSPLKQKLDLQLNRKQDAESKKKDDQERAEGIQTTENSSRGSRILRIESNRNLVSIPSMSPFSRGLTKNSCHASERKLPPRLSPGPSQSVLSPFRKFSRPKMLEYYYNRVKPNFSPLPKVHRKLEIDKSFLKYSEKRVQSIKKVRIWDL